MLSLVNDAIGVIEIEINNKFHNCRTFKSMVNIRLLYCFWIKLGNNRRFLQDYS